MSTAPRETLLATLLQLEQRARACTSPQELAFLMVNDSHALAPYRQAALWRAGDGGDGTIEALSGLAVPERNAPFNVWLSALLARRLRDGAGLAAGPLQPAAEDAAMWVEHLPPHAWLLPLALDDAQRPDAALLLARDTPWDKRETTLLGLLADAYAHAWRALRPATRQRRGPAQWWSGLRHGAHRRRWWLGLALAVTALLFVPVRQSVLAPAEIVARAPMAVRAPLAGVVDSIAVTPNQAVQQGQLLATLDAREVNGKLESARQALAVADAELRQTQQQALYDERSKAALALARGKRAQAQNDVAYYQEALARTQLRAERDGIALFDDVSDWIGRPVALGERIMMVADPKDAELEVQLPVADAIRLPEAAELRLFLNAAPTSPLPASLLRVGYRAAPTPDGTLAYRVRAQLHPADGQETLPRIGLKGTAKLYGERTPLFAYLLRRPLASLRVWLGL